MAQLPGVLRHEVIATLRDLQAQGRGKFIPGRHGHPSRFIAGQAASNSNHMATNESAMDELDPKHVLILRKSPLLSLSLPTDLTPEEVDRIVRWVQALPID
ncbi:MAG TPA: hypothetical protein VGL58_08745 [Caulobacteraceae bacterium]|jgi:hypothetical protein